MDPISQGLLGAALCQSSVKKRSHLKAAAIYGAFGGMAPDLDIFIRSQSDPLLAIEYHRHFTHSLAFVPIGGLLVALAFWFILRYRKLSFPYVYAYTTLGLFTHALLDACTSYGTQLLWPFSDLRVSWNIISVIDPIYTFTLLIFCVLSLWRNSVTLMRVGLALSTLYLGFGWYQHEAVKTFITQTAEQRGHSIERLLLNPTIGNTLLWRSVYQSGNYYYVDAVYQFPLGEPLLYEGKKVAVIDKETVFPELSDDSTQRRDIRRFAYFSQDYIYLHPDDPLMIADLRYGTLPYDDQSLWGIRIDTSNPNAHVSFGNLRNINDNNLDEFWLMLNGKFSDNITDTAK